MANAQKLLDLLYLIWYSTSWVKVWISPGCGSFFAAFFIFRSPAGNANLLTGVGSSGHVRRCGLPATVGSFGPAALRSREQRFPPRPFARRTHSLQTSKAYLSQLESTLVKSLASVGLC